MHATPSATDLDELGETLQGAVTALEGNRCLVLAGWEEDDGGKALHLNLGVLVLSAVHLSDDHGVHLLEALGKLLVDRLELLAVPAPRCINL